MARNRKRAKERRDRRPQTVGSRSSLGGTGAMGLPAPLEHATPADEGTPSPLEHATPDAELAEAQLALGRIGSPDDGTNSAVADEELEPSDDGGGRGGTDIGAGFGGGGDGGSEPPGGGEVALPGPVGEPGVRPRNRLIAFLEGSWRELQRVQWPDRRQVMQATAVVLGFVIVAGIVLAVADTLASHLMSYILTGTHSVLAWVAVGVIVLSLAGWMLADRDR